MDNMLAWLPCGPSVSFRGVEEPEAYPISGSFASTSRWFDVGLTLADRAAARQSRRGAILIVTTTSGASLQAVSNFSTEDVVLPRALRLSCTGRVPPDVSFALGSHRHRILFVRPMGEYLTPQTAARVAYIRCRQLCSAYRGSSAQHPRGSRARIRSARAAVDRKGEWR